MHYSRALGVLALLLSQVLLILPAKAAIFPDVPDGHLYRMQIESLVGLKVINGNADGSYKPEKGVNRAELLAMLYRATGKTPDSSKRNCFPDVQPGSWYELYVCDASAKGFVGGYPDGYFRPSKEVNRVEALKMITLVFGMQVPEVQSSNWASVTFSDVASNQWYAKYLLHAYNMSIIPIPGMSASVFMPEAILKRGEAAAFIYNALHASPRQQNGMSASSAPAQNAVSSTPGRSARSSQSSMGGTVIKTLSIPASVSGNFQKKNSVAYRFSLAASLSIAVDVKLGGSFVGDNVSCRLYKLETDGFSTEYYLGYQETSTCQLRVKLSPGEYQLELNPSVADAVYTMDVKTMKGDGNDGFSEAKPLLWNQPRSDSLEVGDLADWYKFSLTAEKQMMLEITNETEYLCIVYPMADVDIYGFEGPKCGESYMFPKGTYYVGIVRKQGHPDRAIYSLRMK
jgi:hypothetical protein